MPSPSKTVPESTTAPGLPGATSSFSGRRDRPIVKYGPTVCDGVSAERQWSSSGVAVRPPSTMSNR